MADWAGEVYVYEGEGRLFRGTTKIRQDGLQEPMGGKKRVIRSAVRDSTDAVSTWWQDLRRQTAGGEDERGGEQRGNRPLTLFKVI